MKKCTKCKEIKKLENFYFRKDRNSYISICNSCVKEDTILYYNNKKEYHRKRARKIYQNNRERSLIKCYARSDKKKNLINNLTINWMKENITSKSCTYCGDTENLGCDRIDNTKGHTMDNCVPCCKLCNMTRGNRFSFKEMKNHIGPAISAIANDRKT